MSLIAEIRLFSDDMVLASTLVSLPDVTLTVEHEFATDPNRPFLFFWAEGTPFARVESALGRDETVTDVTTLDTMDDRRLYRVQFTDAVVTLYPVYVQLGAALLNLVGTDDGWLAELRFPDREALGQFRDFCLDHDIAFDLRRLYDPDGRQRDAREESPSRAVSLTGNQREALAAALDAGYFEVPRETSLTELGDVLGISDQAASERLRRGLTSVLEDVFDGEKSTRSYSS